MRRCYSMAKEDLQEIQYLDDTILGYSEEEPTCTNIKKIKGIAKRVKKITEGWND